MQFVGDALLAVFNAPARQPDHAVRAARAGLLMQTAVARIAAGHTGWPRFRVGINELRNFNAMGDAVNVAARLQTVAEPGQVVIGAATRAALGPGACTLPLGDLTVKGRRQPVPAYLLASLDAAR